MLDKILEGATKIKLTGGLVGRVCTVVLVTVLGITVIAASSSIWWVAPLAIVALLSFVFIILSRVLAIAQNNPHAAILDGAEFFQYEKLILASKNNPLIQVTATSQIEEYTLPAIADSIINQPDVEILPTQSSTEEGEK
jgi:hypothetical protein